MKTHKIFVNSVIVGIFMLLASAANLYAANQTPTPTPSPSPTPSERERQLEEEKRIKNLEKDIAEAKKAIREAQPQPKSTLLAGSTTLTDVKIENTLVTYRAVSNSLKKIAGMIKSRAGDAQIIIFYSQGRSHRFVETL